MSENAAPTVDVEKTPAEKGTHASEGYLQAAAELTKAIQAMGETAADLKAIKELESKRSAEQAKLRPAANSGNFLAKSMDDAISRPARGNAELEEMQKLNDRSIVRALVRARKSGMDLPRDSEGGYRLDAIPKEAFVSDEFKELQDYRAKAAGSFWDTATTSGGAEWTPTGFSSQVVDFYTIDNDIPALFGQIDIPDNVGDFKVSVDQTRGHAVIWGQKTSAQGNFVDTSIFSQAQSGTADFSPKKHANGHAVSMEGNEDLAFDAMNRAIAGTQNSVRWGVTEALINGQTASDATLDDAPAVSGLYAADGYSNAAGDNGLRLHCIAGGFTTAIGGNLTVANVLAMRESMGKYGARSSENVLICSPKAYLGLLQDTNVMLVQNYGTGATVVTGELANAGGVPIVMTTEFPEALASTGIDNNPGTSSTTGAILVNRSRWWFARKRAMTTTLLPQPGQDIMNVITTARTHFCVSVSGEHSAHYAINLT